MIIPSDRAWFLAHPNRAYRVRPVPHEDANFWMRPAAIDLYLWCVIRRADGAIRYFTMPAYAALDDTDDELGPAFAQLPAREESAPTTFAPTPGGNLAHIEAGLSALLVASIPFEPDSPPAAAYREEMRARGREVLALGGRETLSYLAGRIVEAMPERAAIHAAILQVAWDGLVELRP